MQQMLNKNQNSKHKEIVDRQEQNNCSLLNDASFLIKTIFYINKNIKSNKLKYILG